MKIFKRILAAVTAVGMLPATVFAEKSLSSDIKCNINLMYDGVYTENVLSYNKELSVPIKLTNTTSASENATCYIAEYDENNILINSPEKTDITVPASGSSEITLTKSFSENAKTAKILVWKSGNLKPLTAAVSLQSSESDYYANSASDAAEFDITKQISGKINTSGDVDYIKLTPSESGAYTFNCIALENINVALYDENKSTLQTDSQSFTYSLEKDKTYYLKAAGNVGEYLLIVQKDVPSEAELFNIYDYDDNINIYKKSIPELCKNMYYSKLALSKQMYNEYESILSDDAKLHALPDFLSAYPKGSENYDTAINRYYKTKYTEFVNIENKYKDLIGTYTDTSSTTSNDGVLYSLSGNAAPTLMQDDTTLFDTPTQTATPSLIIDSVTSNSITYTATFPTTKKWGNIIRLIDFNTDSGLTSNTNYYGGDEYRPSGQQTISGLKTGGVYILCLCWSSDGLWSGGSNSIFRFVQLPDETEETLNSYSSGRITANLDATDKAIATEADFNTWLDRMNVIYDCYEDLTGYTPNDATKIEITSTKDNLNELFEIEDGYNYWNAIFGYYDDNNVFKYGNAYYKGLLRRLASGDWGWMPINEMGRIFNNDKWAFDGDALAQLGTYYAVEKSNAKIYDCTENANVLWYTGSEFYNYLKTNHYSKSYKNTFEQGSYASVGFAALLIDIEKQIGWEPFKMTFRYFNSSDYSQLPEDSGEKLCLFLTKLRDYSGTDVLSLISDNDKQVLESYYGVSLGYSDTFYPTISSGSSGTNQFDINMYKGNFAAYEFTPSSTANYSFFTSPYGESGASNDTKIEVFTDNTLSGTPVASNDDYDNGRFSKVTFSATADTTYYIKVSNYSGGQLHARLNCVKDKTVLPLTLSGYQDVSISYGEYQMLSFTPDTTGEYTFDVGKYKGTTAASNTYIKLYDSVDMTTQIANGEKQITATLIGGQTYYLKFSGFLMKSGKGRITVTN